MRRGFFQFLKYLLVCAIWSLPRDGVGGTKLEDDIFLGLSELKCGNLSGHACHAFIIFYFILYERCIILYERCILYHLKGNIGQAYILWYCHSPANRALIIGYCCELKCNKHSTFVASVFTVKNTCHYYRVFIWNRRKVFLGFCLKKRSTSILAYLHICAY